MKPKVDWITPVFPSLCLTAMLVTAYGGFRGDSIHGIISSIAWFLIAYCDIQLNKKEVKGLPKESY